MMPQAIHDPFNKQILRNLNVTLFQSTILELDGHLILDYLNVRSLIYNKAK